MLRDYSRDDVERLFVLAFESGDRELAVVALQVARTAEIRPLDLCKTILDRCSHPNQKAIKEVGLRGELDLPLQFLLDADWQTQADVAEALCSVGGPRVRTALTRVLNEDPNKYVRRHMTAALEAMPERELSVELEPLNANGRLMASVCLGDSDFNDFARSIDHASVVVRTLADKHVRSICLADPTAARRLADLIASSVEARCSERLRETLRWALGGMGEAAAFSLDRAFRENPVVRRDEGHFVGLTMGATAIPTLLEALGDSHRAVRLSAADGLVSVGRAAVFELLDLLRAPTTSVQLRRDVLHVLARIGDPSALDAVETLIIAPATAGVPLPVRDAAIESLGAFPTDRTVHILRRLIQDPLHRAGAVRALGELAKTGHCPPALPPLLHELLTGPSPALRRHAFRFLQRVWERTDPPLDRVRQTLVEILADPESDLIDDATRCLRALESEQSLRAQEWGTYHFGEPRRGLQFPDPESEARRFPVPVTDGVHFSVSAPLESAPGDEFMLGVWIHSGHSRIWEMAKRQQRGKPTHVDSRGPVAVPLTVDITVHIAIPAFGVTDLGDTIHWSGDSFDSFGNCSFAVAVPIDATKGLHFGRATFSIGDIPISRLEFALQIGASNGMHEDVTAYEARFHRAFACYAAEDRGRVMGRIQGMLKVVPELEIFVDVISQRSGEKWVDRVTEEIVARDVFLLFWSVAASRSEWVAYEWKTALRHKGLDAISPVPLDPPTAAPPPAELASLHFSDVTLAFERFDQVN
jgi:HEAT repeat protein